VAVASEHKRKLRTFSFGFEDAVSELPFANEIARRYGTDHRELTARNVDIAEMLLLMNNIYDEPFADSSNIPTYLMSKLAREELKVVLTGDGADELLGGYGWWYLPLYYMTETWAGRAAGVDLAKRFVSVTDAHEARSTYFSDAELKGLFLNGYSADTHQRTYSWASTNTVNDSLMMDLENYMAGDILVKTDRASMANGLELRAPFLDVDFASFCISLPSMLKIRNGQDKYLLREAYGPAWTEKIRRRDKQGFGAPVDRWLARPSVQRLKQDYLGNARRKIFSFLRFSEVQKMSPDYSYKTWALLVLALWVEGHNFDV
jgi:asparagine synthase (glutamine-hydrolysing)